MSKMSHWDIFIPSNNNKSQRRKVTISGIDPADQRFDTLHSSVEQLNLQHYFNEVSKIRSQGPIYKRSEDE